MNPFARGLAVSGFVVAALFAPAAHAGLFDDDEARRAILDLRQRLEQSNQQAQARQAEQMARMSEQMTQQLSQMRKSLLDLNDRIDAMGADNARLRGQNEQLARDVADLQRQQKDVAQGVEDRIRKLEPQKAQLEGQEILVDPEEKRQFDEAMAVLRRAEFDRATLALVAFQKRYPASSYRESVLFWLGNAQYGQRDYKGAITSFRALVSAAPQHPRAPEAVLAIANCQLELKDPKAARRTLSELMTAYPKSEAALAGRERLASIKS
ncbi:MAG: tol-pal system protein YbgF [Burkholderiaceae bacterium]